MDTKQSEKQTGRKEPKRQKRWPPTAKAIVLAAIIGIIGSIVVALIQKYYPPDRRNESGEVGPKSDESIEPPSPPGLTIFDANEWYEEVGTGKKEIVCEFQTELNVELRKVGVGMKDATVERCLTYSKPQNDALEIEYEFAESTEIGVHFLIYGFRKDPADFVRLDAYEEGHVFLRIKPMPIDYGANIGDYPAVAFGLKLRQRDIWFWDNARHSPSQAELVKQSGWCDIRIPIKPYLDQMRKASSSPKTSEFFQACTR